MKDSHITILMDGRLLVGGATGLGLRQNSDYVSGGEKSPGPQHIPILDFGLGSIN